MLNNLTLQGKPFISETPGVCAVELILDPITYETEIRGIWISCDCGEIYDKHSALATIRKNIPLAISKIIAEKILFINGTLIPKDTIQYDVLSPALTPETTISFLESSSPPRGIGSIAHNLLPAAYAAALAQITGGQVMSIPIENISVYEALEKTGGNA